MQHSVSSLFTELAKLPSPLYVMLVGLVGSGKSTLVEQLRGWNRGFVVLSTDDLLMEEAEKLGLTYSQAFGRVSQSLLKRRYNELLQDAVTLQRDILVDQTNLVASSRAKKLKSVSDTYCKVCVIVECDETERQRRLKARAEREGKEIPAHVQASMLKSYLAPHKGEGFDKILQVRG